MKLNERATFWLDSWVSKVSNTNEVARANAKAIALHIAGLQERNAVLEDALIWAALSLRYAGTPEQWYWPGDEAPPAPLLAALAPSDGSCQACGGKGCKHCSAAALAESEVSAQKKEKEKTS